MCDPKSNHLPCDPSARLLETWRREYNRYKPVNSSALRHILPRAGSLLYNLGNGWVLPEKRTDKRGLVDQEKLMIPDEIGHRMWDRIYAGVFLLVVLIWPVGTFTAGIRERNLGLLAIAIINALLIALVWYYCSHPGMSFFRALGIISAAFQGGCAQMTLMLMPWVLTIGLSAALIFTIAGFFKGRSFTQEKWAKYVANQYRSQQGIK